MTLLSPTASRVLVTGGGGYLGFRVASQYLEKTDLHVVLTVHARSPADLAQKEQQLREALQADPERLTVVALELRSEDPFAALDPLTFVDIVHGAAVVRFNVEQETAETVNVQGTRKLLSFASRCPALKSVGLLSSVYASGLRAGDIPEERLDGTSRFANHYERSKWLSEELLFQEFPSLPWKIFRISTVLADDDGGKVTQQNAVHNTLKLFYYGLISLVPGVPETPVYLVTGDFVAEAVLQGMQKGGARRIFHVSHTAEGSLTLGQMIDVAFDSFLEDPEFKRRRLLKPLYADEKSFDVLVKGMAGLGGDVLSQALTSVAPFGAQLYVPKKVRNDALRGLLPGYQTPDAVALLRKTCAHLISQRFRRASAKESPP